MLFNIFLHFRRSFASSCHSGTCNSLNSGFTQARCPARVTAASQMSRAGTRCFGYLPAPYPGVVQGALPIHSETPSAWPGLPCPLDHLGLPFGSKPSSTQPRFIWQMVGSRKPQEEGRRHCLPAWQAPCGPAHRPRSRCVS
jgi:hypothetical protein